MGFAGRKVSESMIKVKHFMEPTESNDGPRVWVEPVRLNQDLREWCPVDEVLAMLSPPCDLWEWFADHPDEYENFRDRYHEWLSANHHHPLLQQLACGSLRGNFTLLHTGHHADRNCAAALKEFMTELAGCSLQLPSTLQHACS